MPLAISADAVGSGQDGGVAGASADEPMSAAPVAAKSAREALAAAVRRSLTRPGSVPPAEQHRLIIAERQAEQVSAEVLTARTAQPR